MSFGAGLVAMLNILAVPLNDLHAYSLGITAIGLAIVIKTLSTIKKIEILID
jgi:hypothetical protein